MHFAFPIHTFIMYLCDVFISDVERCENIMLTLVKGVLHPAMSDILFFNIKIFCNLNFKYVHIYRVNKQKIKNSSMGVRNSTKRPEIRHLRRKGYHKN